MNVISKLITYDFTYYGSRPCCACACTLLAWRTSPRKPPKHPYAQHRPSAPRMPLDPIRAVGAVQVGAAIGAEVVAGLYVDHRVSAHGALLSLACRHTRYAGIRFILLILAGRCRWQLPPGTHARACSKIAICLPGSQTRAAATTPGSGGTKICTNYVRILLQSRSSRRCRGCFGDGRTSCDRSCARPL